MTEGPEGNQDGTERSNDLGADKIKINGKTYFFQMRKDDFGNETIYKRVRDFKRDGFGEQREEVEFIIEEGPKERNSPFESLKNRRRDFLVSIHFFINNCMDGAFKFWLSSLLFKKSERTKHLHSVQLLDSEWKYNTNNQYLEIPDIAAELYRGMQDGYQGMHDISTIRILFETSPDTEDILTFNLDCIKNNSRDIVVDAELLVFR